jgi:hypothetical protein
VKKTLALLALLVIALLFGMRHELLKPTVADFASDTRQIELVEIQINGQGRQVVLNDSEALNYLTFRPKHKALPPNVQISGGCVSSAN